MNVLILNGSPKADAGCTGVVLRNLVPGMQRAGAQVEIINLARLKIKQCIGCMNCWLKTPGQCVHQDDMQPIIEKIVACDAMLWATPLYHYHVTALLKTAIERTLPMALPWILPDPKAPQRSHHPERWSRKTDTPLKLGLLSVCGFPEFNHFDQLLNWFRFYITLGDVSNWAEILRPAAELLKIPELKVFVDKYLQVAEKAGYEMVADGKISEAIKQELLMDLMPGGNEQFRTMVNQHFAEMLGCQPPG